MSLVKNRANRVNKTEKADIAHDLYREIVDTIPEETLRVFKLGHLFKRIRDEKLYDHLDSECDNFKQFCADPKVGYAYSTISSFIKIWEVYIEELHLSMDTLRHIRYKRLQLILPHVSKDPDEWLSRAREWSHKDLINETRRLGGRPPMKTIDTFSRRVDAGKNYIEYVKAHGCILHSGRKSLGAHFPKTRGAGAALDEIIPLCEECELEQHRGVVSFFEKYRNQICQFYYATIKMLFATKSNVVDKQEVKK